MLSLLGLFKASLPARDAERKSRLEEVQSHPLPTPTQHLHSSVLLLSWRCGYAGEGPGVPCLERGEPKEAGPMVCGDLAAASSWEARMP